MSVTDGDRERAADVCTDMPGVDFEDNGESWREKVQYVAAALAEEREKARAPFLALADEMEHHDAELCSAMAARKRLEFNLASEAAYVMQAADLLMVAHRIRRAAGVTE